MQLRWRLYWAGLGTSVLSLAYWANWRRYKDKGWVFVLTKSLADTALLGVLAAYCQPLLTALCVYWIADKIAKKGVWKTVASVLAGMSLGALGGVFLEGILVVGTFSMHLISGEFVKNWRLRGETPAKPKPSQRKAA